MRRYTLPKGDTVITAFAEYANGPGWSNRPVWLIVRNSKGILRQDCIQPEDQTNEIITLYSTSAAIHKAMTDAVTTFVTRRRSIYKGKKVGPTFCPNCSGYVGGGRCPRCSKRKKAT